MKICSIEKEFDYLAPDGSEIRSLSNGMRGGLCHCSLHQGQVSNAVKHKTVDELWYFLNGEAEVWVNKDQESIVKIVKGESIYLPVGTSFQFRNIGTTILEVIIVTMPKWPGENEAIQVEGKWNRIA